MENMSDDVPTVAVSTTVSKSAKKNKKKKKESHQSKTNDVKQEPNFNEMLEQLKNKLEIAKTENNHARAGELRNQIWVLKDMSHGVKTKISDEDLDKILDGIRKELDSFPAKKDEAKTTTTSDEVGGALAVTTTTINDNKRMKNLEKRLDQIKTLKERLKNGEKLESNQIEKINSESSVREEIKVLAELLANVEIKP